MQEVIGPVFPLVFPSIDKKGRLARSQPKRPLRRQHPK